MRDPTGPSDASASTATAPTTGPHASDPARRRIGRILQINLGILATVISGLIVIQVAVVSSGWILVIIALTSLYTSSLVWAMVRTARGELSRAVIAMNLAIWPLAVISTLIAPVAFPITSLSGLAPVLLAVSETSRRAVARLLALSVAMTLLITIVATRTDLTGLGERVPESVLDLVVVLAVPSLVVLVVIMGWQNHRLLVERTAEIRDASARFVAATDAERRRLERDLHDGAQQRLHGALVQISVARRLAGTQPDRAVSFVADAADELRAAVAELRDLVDNLRPAVLVDLGLGGALRSLASRRPGPVVMSIGDVDGLPDDVQAAVWFCSLEAIANVDRHAGPGCRVRVAIDRDPGGPVRFEITDDGRGMTVPDPLPLSGGLRNMSDRVASLRGTFGVRSSPLGTTVFGEIPVGEIPVAEIPVRDKGIS